jgi:cellulose synthase operon protein C
MIMWQADNWRSGAGLVVLVVSLTLAACGARLTADERLDRARADLSAGNATSAAIHLRNVLQEDPVNVPARVLLAEAALLSGDVDSAAKEFERAVDLGADLDEFRAKYAEALVRAGATEQALRLTDPQAAGDGAELSFWRALALLHKGALDESTTLLEAAASDPVMRVPALIGLARLGIARQRTGDALALLDRVSAEAARDSDYWEVRAAALSQSGEHEAAAEAFEKAAETVVDMTGRRQFIYRAGAVESLLAAGKLPEARRKAEQMHQAAEHNPISNHLMARVELQSGNAQQAMAYAQAILAADPDSSRGMMMVGAAHLALGERLQAERHLERAVAANPEDAKARHLLAQARLELDAPDRVLEALGPMAAAGSDEMAATLAGVASVRAGDPEAAVDIFRQRLEFNPADDQARTMLAISLMAAGRVEEALVELGRVSPADEAARLRTAIITIGVHLKSGDVDRARVDAAALSQANPGNAALRNTLGGLFLARNLPQDAVAWFEEGLRLDPGSHAARFSLGQIAAATGQLDDAVSQFAAIVADDPGNTAALAALGRIEWARGNRDAAIKHMQKAREADPADAKGRTLLAGYLVTIGNVAEGLEVAREAVRAAPQFAPAANALGWALLWSGSPREALAEFIRADDLTPGVPVYLVNKARAEAALDDARAARQTLINALALDPEDVRGLVALFDVELRLGRIDGAAQALRRLEGAMSPGDPAVELRRGELRLAQQDFAGAERSFSSVLQAGTSGRAAIGVHEARLQGGQGDPAEPLRYWLEERPGDRAVRRVLAGYYLERREYGHAIEEYETIVEQFPDDPAMLNNLAWLYHQSGDDRALALAERAHRLAPNNPFIADTLGWILHKQGDTRRALQLISEAARAVPDAGEIQYHYAVLLAESGDKAGAIRAARVVLGELSAANHHESAQKLIDSLEKAGD